MFELERFIDDCESVVLAGGQEAVREVLARAIADAAGSWPRWVNPRGRGSGFYIDRHD